MKYHIDKNGKPAICRATKRPCPLGGEDSHFDTYEEAEAAASERMQKQYSLMPSVESNKVTREIEDPTERKEYIKNRLEALGQARGGDNYAKRCLSAIEIEPLDEFINSSHMKKDRTWREDASKESYGEGKLVGTFRVYHERDRRNGMVYQKAEIYDTGLMIMYDDQTLKKITVFHAHGARVEALMLKAGIIPTDEFVNLATERHIASKRQRRPRRNKE